MRLYTAALFALMAAVAAPAQEAVWADPTFDRLALAFYEASLAASADAVTIQQPSTAIRAVHFDAAVVYCSVECLLTIERGGTAATSTAITPRAVNGGYTVTARAFRTSNAGVGTVLAKFRVAAGEEKVVSLRGVKLRAVAGDNVTLRIGSITGDVRILVRWGEK